MVDWRERRRQAGLEWPDFGQASSEAERREQLRSIADAVKFVETGRHVDVELTSEWVEHPVTGEPLEVLGWRMDARGANVPWCGEPVRRRGASGQAWTEYCETPAGHGTGHEGAGPCARHAPRLGRGTGAWVMAHAFARALNVTAWEAMMTAVRISAGRVAFIEAKLGTAECDEDLMPDGRLWHWVRESKDERDRLLRVSKAAIDAGVAERLVRQIELEAALMLRATTLTLDELGLSEDERTRALGIMSRNLLALEAEQAGEERNDE